MSLEETRLLRHHRSLISMLAFTLTAGTANDARAQDLEPRAYSNTPVGLNFLIAGYGYSEGGVVADAALPLENGKIEVHGGVLAYARSMDAWGRFSKLEVVLPYASASGRATFAGELRTREISGFGDPRVRFSVNLLGGPARTLAELATQPPAMTVGASLQVFIPAGQYNPQKLINIGTNRWAVKGEFGLSKPLGPLTMEFAAGAAFFGDNDDFFNGQFREQQEIYSLQAHLIYHFRGGMWGALSATWYTGGRTIVDDIRNDDLQENTRFGFAVARPLSRKDSIRLYGSIGVATRIGSDFDTVGIAWQRHWGGS